MFMSAENVQKRNENDLSVLNGTGERDTSPRSNSPAISSGGSSVDQEITERSNSSDRAVSCNGIVEVSDKELEDEEEMSQRQGPPMSLSNFRRANHNAFLSPCGHPQPPADVKLIKRWAGNGRTWCSICNPILSKNIVRNGAERSGWRRYMESLIERNILPISVLNINETFVYTGNNGVDVNLVQSTDESPFMYDLDVFLKVVCANDLCRLPLRALTCLRSFIHSDTRIIPFFQKIHPLSLCHFSVNLLETAIRLMEEPCEQSEVAFRRSKTALQCFYQTAARVPFFRETIYKHQLSQWLSLLRIEFLRHDMILCVMVVIREMHSWFFRSEDLYIRLLSDMIVLWGSPAVMAEHRAFVTNIFIILFDMDTDFLYDASRLMDREIFSELLVILESALNFTPICRLRDYELHISSKVCLNPSNLSFCLELLEQVDRELSECRQPRYDISVRLTMLVDIINLCAASRGIYDNVLHKSQKAISLMCGVLKALMFAQREVGSLLIRAQYMMNTSAQNAGNQNHNAPRQRSEQHGRSPTLRPIRKAIQNVRGAIAAGNRRFKRAEADAEECDGASDESDVEIKTQKTAESIRILLNANNQKNQLINMEVDETKQENVPPVARITPFLAQANGIDGEPLRKQARLDSNSSNEALPDSQQMESLEPIQLENCADLEEQKPLISPTSDCSSSSDEAPKLNPIKRLPVSMNQAMGKVLIGAQQQTAINISNKTNNCYEEMEDDEEEEGSDDDLDLEADSSGDEIDGGLTAHVDGIFGPRAETLFSEYMSDRPPDFTLESLNEDELLRGLPLFHSIQPIYTMVVGRNIPPHMFSSLKQSTLRAISNLCRDSARNQVVAGRLEAIPLILQCSMRQEGERSVMLQLAIVTLKSLCLNCPENQNRLLEITEGCSHFMNRERLFTAMGLQLEVDSNGKKSLVPLPEVNLVPVVDENKPTT
ncbi:hypothetical protein M3Y94_00537300 [Aphelenchoides besseyi]|nr:hypothetical protein M3Y94_00537300 [Aphelenchoides besseyi]KAI6225801.1 Ataxin-10 [Aphelenchoides besseyi]